VKGTFHKSLLINFDQTGINLVSKSNYTYEKKGSKSVRMVGQEDKRQITAVVGSSADGDLLPLQLIFQGKTDASHPELTSTVRQAQFHITHSENHWSNQDTMQQYVEQIIIPYMNQKIKEHNLPPDSKAIVQLDCWSVHKSVEFRSWIKKYPQLILVFIPPNCTSTLQVADVMLNTPFKHGIKRRFNQWLAGIVEEQIEAGAEMIQIQPHLRMSVLKPLMLQWSFEAWNQMRQQRQFIMSGWHQSLFFLMNVFDQQQQTAALQEVVQNALQLEMHFAGTDEQEQDEDDKWDEADSDEEKDELDLMKEIHIGTRRSSRNNIGKPPQTLHAYMRLDPEAIESDDEEESSDTPPASKKRKTSSKKK